MAVSKTSAQAPVGQVVQGGDKKPLPLTFISSERIMKEIMAVTGLKEEDVKFFRKPLVLQTRLSNAVARYYLAVLADKELADKLGGKPPTTQFLLAPPKPVGFRVFKWSDGEFVEKPVFGEEWLPRCMRDVYLDLVSTVPASEKVKRHVYPSLVNPDPKLNPAVTVAAEVFKNLHLAFKPAKDTIEVVPHFVGEDPDKLALRLAKAA